MIFTSREDLDATELIVSLNEDLAARLRPDRIIFIVRDDCVGTVFQDIQHIVSRPGELRIDLEELPSGIIAFDLHGHLSKQKAISKDWTNLEPHDLATLQAEGVLDIFLRRDGLIKPGPGVHYVHPSGRHSRAFIRAANALISGPEVMFIAAALLPYLHVDTSFIWTDTSSISSLAYAMVALRRSMEPAYRHPTVSSFSSYSGIEDVPFSHFAQSLCLISATTSGNLAKRAIDRGFAASNVINVFSLASNPAPAQVLCDLYNNDSINPSKRFTSNNEFTASTCPMCKNGSKMVHFVGDQFLAESVTYEPYLLRQEDLPRSTGEALREFVGQKAFGLRAKDRNADTTVNDFWIDVPRLVGEESMKTLVARAAMRFLPLATSVLISTDEPAAFQVASIFADALSGSLVKPPEVKRFSEIEDEAALKCQAGAVVVTSCIDSGTSLQRVSRALRNPLKHNPRVYLGLFAKHGHLGGFENLKSDLIFNDSNLPHGFHCLYRMAMPVLPRRSAWVHELEMLQDLLFRIRSKKEGYPSEALGQVEARITTLQQLGQGSCEGLFWTHQEESLKLRQTFAFWRFKHDLRLASDGDVLATVACVVENMRHGSHAPLRSTAFFQGVISPSCFGRFNDGVIQAALLRSALPQELNFEAAPELSHLMIGVLESVVSAYAKPQGEALLEFLVSIATGRLKLMPAHLDQLLAKAPGELPIIKALVKFINERPKI